jgi:hypothetical protein
MHVRGDKLSKTACMHVSPELEEDDAYAFKTSTIRGEASPFDRARVTAGAAQKVLDASRGPYHGQLL